MIVVLPPACHPAVACSKTSTAFTIEPCQRRRHITATTFNAMKYSVMLFIGKRGRKSHFCTPNAMVLGQATVEQSGRTQHLHWCHTGSVAVLDFSCRQLNSPSELQSIHAETIGFLLWKQHFCKASLCKSRLAGTAVRWAHPGFLHPGRLPAS